MTIERITMEHGAGKGLRLLFSEIIKPALLPRFNGTFEDSAVLDPGPGKIAFTSDSFVVQPLEFPGGDIGKLAACGTINDLSMMGATPKYMAVSLILEEGLETSMLWRALISLREICDSCGVEITCGDTKVVDTGHGSGIYITTTGIGTVPSGLKLSSAYARDGDSVIVSGPIGLHGVAILAQRKQLGFASDAVSDCAPLADSSKALIIAVPSTRVMRDATRGGCAAVLNEIAVDSGVTIRLDSAQIPVSPTVAGACSYLGFDPLQIANEGTFVAIVPSDAVDTALSALRGIAQSRNACVIGIVVKKGRFPVIINTDIGGTRPVEIPPGDLLPRIC